jgi:hypothetical protein
VGFVGKRDNSDTDEECRTSTFYYYIKLLLSYIQVSNKTLKYLSIWGIFWHIMKNIEMHLLNSEQITINSASKIILYESMFYLIWLKYCMKVYAVTDFRH